MEFRVEVRLVSGEDTCNAITGARGEILPVARDTALDVEGRRVQPRIGVSVNRALVNMAGGVRVDAGIAAHSIHPCTIRRQDQIIDAPGAVFGRGMVGWGGPGLDGNRDFAAGLNIAHIPDLDDGVALTRGGNVILPVEHPNGGGDRNLLLCPAAGGIHVGLENAVDRLELRYATSNSRRRAFDTGIPDVDVPITGTSGENRGVMGRECDLFYTACVANKNGLAGLRGDVEDPSCLVASSGGLQFIRVVLCEDKNRTHQLVIVVRPGNIENGIVVADYTKENLTKSSGDALFSVQ